MKNTKQLPSIALRLAALMDRERIESLPRNYELVYDVYSGSNPDLTREFAALGEIKTQKALDEIGRKYLPHQHEEGILAKTNSVMQGQMSDFLQLIQDERSSLAEFAKIIDEASQAISSDKNLDRFALAKSINNLSKAAAQQSETNKTLGEAAAAQNAAVAELKNEMEALEALKWADPVTGLANRRSFNKTVVGVYADPNKPTPCGLAVAEFDDFRNFSTSGEYPFSNNYLREIASVFKSANTSGQFIAYLDKGRFAFVLNSEDPGEIMVFVEMIRKALRAKKPIVTKRRTGNAEITLSFGIATATGAGSAHELIQHAEKALADSFTDGGNTVTVYSAGKPTDNRRNWMIYASN